MNLRNGHLVPSEPACDRPDAHSCGCARPQRSGSATDTVAPNSPTGISRISQFRIAVLVAFSQCMPIILIIPMYFVASQLWDASGSVGLYWVANTVAGEAPHGLHRHFRTRSLSYRSLPGRADLASFPWRSLTRNRGLRLSAASC